MHDMYILLVISESCLLSHFVKQTTKEICELFLCDNGTLICKYKNMQIKKIGNVISRSNDSALNSECFDYVYMQISISEVTYFLNTRKVKDVDFVYFFLF